MIDERWAGKSDLIGVLDVTVLAWEPALDRSIRRPRDCSFNVCLSASSGIIRVHVNVTGTRPILSCSLSQYHYHNHHPSRWRRAVHCPSSGQGACPYCTAWAWSAVQHEGWSLRQYEAAGSARLGESMGHAQHMSIDLLPTLGQVHLTRPTNVLHITSLHV